MDLQEGTAFRPSSPLIIGCYLLIAVVAWVFVQTLFAVVWGPPYDLPGLLRPSAAVLRAELARHLPPNLDQGVASNPGARPT